MPFAQLCKILPTVTNRQALYKSQYIIPSCKVNIESFFAYACGKDFLAVQKCSLHESWTYSSLISFWDTWYLCTCYGLLLVDVLGCQKFPLPHPLGSAVSESSKTVYVQTVSTQTDKSIFDDSYNFVKHFRENKIAYFKLKVFI